MTDFSILSEFFRLVLDKWSISMHLRDRARGQGLADGQRQLTLTLTPIAGSTPTQVGPSVTLPSPPPRVVPPSLPARVLLPL